MRKPASQCGVAHTQGPLRTSSKLIKLARKSCRNIFHIPIVGKKANINPLFAFVEGMKLRGAKTKVEYPESPTKDAKSKAVCYFISFLFVPYIDVYGNIFIPNLHICNKYCIDILKMKYKKKKIIWSI